MNLGLSRALVLSAPRRWEAQYGESTDAGKQRITVALNKLDPATATAAEVAAIIGNKSWSYFSCDECGQYVEQAVTVGGEHSENPITLCVSCARAAAALASVVLA